MSWQVTQESQSVGGSRGHAFRRLCHLSLILIPLLYGWYIQCCSERLMPGWLLILLIWLGVSVWEGWRLWTGRLVFAQRSYERKHLSAFFFTVTAVATVLWWAPSTGVTYAIIASCALVDPLLGEGRRHGGKPGWLIVLGLLLTAIIWWVMARLFVFPVWWAFIMAPITVAAEWCKQPWIDDNAMMQWLPLAMSWILVIL